MTRPRSLINFAISADGKISTRDKDPAHFTSKLDLHRLLEIRKRADAILVGRGTLEADQMSITIPNALKPAKQPLRCVVSRTGGFNLSHKLFNSRGGAIHLVVTDPTPDFDPVRYESAGATVHTASLPDFLHRLRTEYNVDTLLCEGGGTLVRTLAELDAIDEIHLTFAGHTLFGGVDAPTITGPLADHLPASRHFQLDHFEPLDNGECFLSYSRPA
jgi:2,5-diamino-6-(ribosylamino)-4(3H)-pyrimidinone 5'-phosphate reductase